MERNAKTLRLGVDAEGMANDWIAGGNDTSADAMRAGGGGVVVVVTALHAVAAVMRRSAAVFIVLAT